MTFLRVVMITVGVSSVLLVLFTAVSDYSFNKLVEREINVLKGGIDTQNTSPALINDLEALPEPVQRYVHYTLKEPPAGILFVRLHHSGLFRTSPRQRWLPVQGEEFFTTDTPAFLWYAKVTMSPLVWVKARDSYYQGKGSMLIKVFSALTITEAKSRELDQSSLVRWLSETPWFPTALMPSSYLRWEEIDANSARVIVEDHGLTVSGIFSFNDKGQITRFATDDRFMTVDGKQVRVPWTAYYRKYQEKNGFMVPTEVEAVWNLEDENFSYAQFQVDDIEYEFRSK